MHSSKAPIEMHSSKAPKDSKHTVTSGHTSTTGASNVLAVDKNFVALSGQDVFSTAHDDSEPESAGRCVALDGQYEDGQTHIVKSKAGHVHIEAGAFVGAPTPRGVDASDALCAVHDDSEGSASSSRSNKLLMGAKRPGR
jgi:hypothetical protein